MTNSLYVLGGAGVGKSLMLRNLLAEWTVGPYERLTSKEMFGHYCEHDLLGTGLYLGHLRPQFPGTDALSMSVSPQARLWLETARADLTWVWGEGVRLGHVKFQAALAERFHHTVVHMVLDQAVQQQRLEDRLMCELPMGRFRKQGEAPAESHVKTTVTKAERSAAACREAGLHVETVDASGTPGEVLGEVLRALGGSHPVG